MAERLTQMIEAFNLFDKNRDGFITSNELGDVLKSLDRNITGSELLDMIREIAADGNTAIDFLEFKNLMESKLNDIDSEEELRGAFKVFDMDQDGFISKAEILHIMHNLEDKLTHEEAEEMIKEADTDGDGLVSYEDFKQIMLSI